MMHQAGKSVPKNSLNGVFTAADVKQSFSSWSCIIAEIMFVFFTGNGGRASISETP